MRADYETSFSKIYSGLSRYYKATLLSTGFNYEFRVTATNAAGTSDFSSSSAQVLAAETPDSPTGLDLMERSDSAVKFMWVAPIDTGGVPLTGYHIYMA